MRDDDWSHVDRWHLLFDTLCRGRGHYDNAVLASELCRRTGKQGEGDHEVAEKNLRNWRLGRRLPLRRNVALLAQLLEVDVNPDLAARWNLLHRVARGGNQPVAGDPPGSAVARDAHHARAFPRRAAFVACVMAAGFAVGGIVPGRFTDNASLGDVAHLPMVSYNARVVVSVGTSKLVNGRSGGCNGELPPEWAQISHRVPESAIGVFQDGGMATQMSNFCGKEVVIRAVRFTALRPGVEELQLLDSYLRIEVVEPPAPTG